MFLVGACGIFSCSMRTWAMWDLVPQPGREPRPPALGVWSLSHWTPREVPTPASWKTASCTLLSHGSSSPFSPWQLQLGTRKSLCCISFHSWLTKGKCLMSVYQVQILYCQSPVSVLDWHCLGTGDAAVNMAKPWPGGVDILTLDILLSFISLVSSSCKNRNPAQRPWLPTHPVHSMTILLGEKPTPFFFTLSSLASFILATFCLPVLWIASMPAQSLKWVTCYWEQALGSDSLGLKPHSSTSVM